MANFQIPLNGGNHVSKEREKAFQDALNDSHVVAKQDLRANKTQTNGKAAPSAEQPDNLGNKADARNGSLHGNGKRVTTESVNSIELGLNHSVAHQSRTMEIHQQFLDQQGEYAKLINAVLDQQGKVLDNGTSGVNQEIINTFQRSLDSFHQIREKGMEVHQQFLAQQADFSHSFVKVLEKQYDLSTNGNGRVEEKKSPNRLVEETIPDSSVPEIVEVPKPDPEPVVDHQEPATEKAGIRLTSQHSNEEISLEILTAALMRIVGDKTGYPPEMLELEMDLEADLGIDSIKRVEILGTLEEEFPSLPPADTEILAQTRTLAEIVDYLISETKSPSPSEADDNKPEISPAPIVVDEVAPEASPAKTGVSVEVLTATLLEIVADKTGYPAEMLESDMDMEADLGIDSIKRVEILGAMEEQVPGLPAVEAESLAELRTLGEIVEMMNNNQGKPLSSVNDEDSTKKKVNTSTIDTTPVDLVPLPVPDHLDFQLPADRPILVTDEGSELTTNFANSMVKKGWKVIIWSFPEVIITRNNKTVSRDVEQVFPKDSSQETIQNTINEIRDAHGVISGFIHLHPAAQDQEDFAALDRSLVKGVFFLAGALKYDLVESQADSRTIFLTVTRLDGQLGLNPSGSFQEAGGLGGIVKTLHWEWPNVYCRSLDLDPSEDNEIQIDWINQEIHDPDRGLIEVGRNGVKRVTIDRVYQNHS